MLAGKLMGDFQGAGSLSVAAGATLVLGGAGVQVAPPAVAIAGGTLEVEPDADVTLVASRRACAAPPRRRRRRLARRRASTTAAPPGAEAAPSDALGDEVAIAAGATLSITAGGGTLALAAHDVLSGSGTLDASLDNGGGTVEPSGALHVTGNYTQGAGATLALDLRSAADADSLRVGGADGTRGHARGDHEVHAGEGGGADRARRRVEAGRNVREGARPAPRRAGLGSGLRCDRASRSASPEGAAHPCR